MKHSLLNLGDKLTREELEEFEKTFEMFVIDDHESGKSFVKMKGLFFVLLFIKSRTNCISFNKFKIL